jgi:hypothetical protein
MVNLLFVMDEAESLRTSDRVKGGMRNRIREGYFVGRAPDGYVNKQEKITPSHTISKYDAGRYHRWIEA